MVSYQLKNKQINNNYKKKKPTRGNAQCGSPSTQLSRLSLCITSSRSACLHNETLSKQQTNERKGNWKSCSISKKKKKKVLI